MGGHAKNFGGDPFDKWSPGKSIKATWAVKEQKSGARGTDSPPGTFRFRMVGAACGAATMEIVTESGGILRIPVCFRCG